VAELSTGQTVFLSTLNTVADVYKANLQAIPNNYETTSFPVNTKTLLIIGVIIAGVVIAKRKRWI